MVARLVQAARDRWSGAERSELRAADTGIREGRFRWRLITLNVPFMIGALIVLFLVAAAFVGPHFATENPYLSAQRTAEMMNGELVAPPFPPSSEFLLGSDQWGRDILSRLLYGARNTLVACLFVTMARVILGLGLGAVAGWRAGGLLDRIVTGAIEILSSLPMLLTGMILIFALDIRKGLSAFLIALCLVGWGEIAQYIRSEFISLRDKPWVEGARVIGLSEPGIIIRHILPNVLPSLVVLTLLEMGSVLMILGELGFVGIFIGGGTQTELIDQRVSIADIPEWGSMLAGSRAYIRNSPWMVFWPAMAFFVAVLGFNFLGEGLRRIIREAGVNTAALISKRMIAAVAIISVLTWYIMAQIGPGVSYAKLANQFDAQNAVQYAQNIVELQQADPGFGTDGARKAAEYIADQLEQYGVQPAAGGQSYFQPVTHYVAHRLSTPVLEVTTESGETVALTHGADFGEQVTRHGGSGQADAPLVFVGFSRSNLGYADFRGLDLTGQVAMVLRGNMTNAFDNEALIRGAQALIVVSEDAAPHTDWLADPNSDYMEKPSIPILYVTPEAADRMLASTGYLVSDLEQLVKDAHSSGSEQAWLTVSMSLRVHARVELSDPVEVTGYNVLGILPGNDTSMDNQALLLSTHYDMPEPDPDHPFLSYGDGPAGVGTMLEIVRLWQAEEFKPRRTILFGVWVGGYSEISGANTYKTVYTPFKSLQISMTLHLAGIGSGGDNLILDSKSATVRGLLERSSQISEIPTQADTVASHAYTGEVTDNSATLAWEGAPDAFSGADTLGALDPEKLSKFGQVVNFALITASRQYHY